MATTITGPEKRFVGACLPVRLVLALGLMRLPPNAAAVRPIALALVCLGLGMGLLSVTGWRSHGWETGGGPIWWKRWRWFHALMYLLAAHLVAGGNARGAGMLLLLDVSFGAALAADHHHWLACR